MTALAPIFILVLFGVFTQPDGHDAPQSYLLGFPSMETCRAAEIKLLQDAHDRAKLPNIVEIGLACVEVDPAYVGQSGA